MSWQKWSNKTCPGLPRLGFLGQTVDDQGKMQHKQVEATVYSVCDTVIAVKTRQSRLRHDRAIQGGNGVLPRPPAKHGEHHRVIRAGCALPRLRQRLTRS